ncbi:hypothetical protein PFMC_03875 [Plasmodium falciparum CAMP/Malaysia]|uniref:Uncharacterized protein n=1 Tax=Plasmodium falciparum (isolate Camp / Malaysia) TaxID=5835 RepID=A0A024X472_PLAFC|nr:hypothetical protein PFMC_03875 [Plasmodium falciparum CAMP/Malaysia]
MHIYFLVIILFYIYQKFILMKYLKKKSNVYMFYYIPSAEKQNCITYTLNSLKNISPLKKKKKNFLLLKKRDNENLCIDIYTTFNKKRKKRKKEKKIDQDKLFLFPLPYGNYTHYSNFVVNRKKRKHLENDKREIKNNFLHASSPGHDDGGDDHELVLQEKRKTKKKKKKILYIL